VHHAGERIQVGVRIIDAATAYPRWAGSFQGDTKDVLALQDEIGRAVVAALGDAAHGGMRTSRAGHGTTSRDAYDFYLRGRHGLDQRSDTGFRAAVQFYRSAISIDSTYAAAYAGLAQAYALTGVAGDYDHFPPRETALKAEAAAEKAIALDDSLGEAHLALGIVRLLGPIGWNEAEREFYRALTLDPADPRIRAFLSVLYCWTERPAAGLREARAPRRRRLALGDGAARAGTGALHVAPL
jgi:Predicted integral membrane protein